MGDSERDRRRELAASQAELRAAAHSSRGTQSASSMAARASNAPTAERTRAGRTDVVEVLDEEMVEQPINPASGTASSAPTAERTRAGRADAVEVLDEERVEPP